MQHSIDTNELTAKPQISDSGSVGVLLMLTTTYKGK